VTFSSRNDLTFRVTFDTTKEQVTTKFLYNTNQFIENKEKPKLSTTVILQNLGGPNQLMQQNTAMQKSNEVKSPMPQKSLENKQAENNLEQQEDQSGQKKSSPNRKIL
jgi:hypothetical protein